MSSVSTPDPQAQRTPERGELRISPEPSLDALQRFLTDYCGRLQQVAIRRGERTGQVTAVLIAAGAWLVVSGNYYQPPFTLKRGMVLEMVHGDLTNIRRVYKSVWHYLRSRSHAGRRIQAEMSEILAVKDEVADVLWQEALTVHQEGNELQAGWFRSHARRGAAKLAGRRTEHTMAAREMFYNLSDLLDSKGRPNTSRNLLLAVSASHRLRRRLGRLEAQSGFMDAKAVSVARYLGSQYAALALLQREVADLLESLRSAKERTPAWISGKSAVLWDIQRALETFAQLASARCAKYLPGEFKLVVQHLDRGADDPWHLDIAVQLLERVDLSLKLAQWRPKIESAVSTVSVLKRGVAAEYIFTDSALSADVENKLLQLSDAFNSAFDNQGSAQTNRSFKRPVLEPVQSVLDRITDTIRGDTLGSATVAGRLEVYYDMLAAAAWPI